MKGFSRTQPNQDGQGRDWRLEAIRQATPAPTRPPKANPTVVQLFFMKCSHNEDSATGTRCPKPRSQIVTSYGKYANLVSVQVADKSTGKSGDNAAFGGVIT
jgi:hypothetical protein